MWGRRKWSWGRCRKCKNQSWSPQSCSRYHPRYTHYHSFLVMTKLCPLTFPYHARFENAEYRRFCIVCFFKRWPQTKCKGIFDTIFWISFYALSHGFAFCGSFFNHFLIGWFFSTANKILWNKRLKRLPWRTKCRLPCERARKTVSETCVKIEYTFCLRPPIEKTNSEKVSAFLHEGLLIRDDSCDTPQYICRFQVKFPLLWSY